MKRTPFSNCYVSCQSLFLRQWTSVIIILAFLTNSFGPCQIAQADEFRLPPPGVMVPLSPQFTPVVLKGVQLDPKNPFRFHFYIDTGNSHLKNMSSPNVLIGDPQQEQLKTESTRLIKYFLASLTIPEKDLWVNLSPYEKDRIVPEEFGQTEMGRDLLAEDYLLKQITASLIYPESQLGKEFWRKVYAQAQAQYGTTNIPINTFNKVWIVPDKAVVYENNGVAFVMENHLKVMLEEDYLSMQKHSPSLVKEGVRGSSEKVNTLGSQIVREIVIPALTKEVNEGKNFAQLRQVFYSLILATWYKKKIKDSILNKIYSNQNKIQGLVIPAKAGIHVEAIYQQYLKAFKKGVFNYIKEEPLFPPPGGEGQGGGRIPRKYFSGGVVVGAFQENLIVEHHDRIHSLSDFGQLGSIYQANVDVAMDIQQPTHPPVEGVLKSDDARQQMFLAQIPADAFDYRHQIALMNAGQHIKDQSFIVKDGTRSVELSVNWEPAPSNRDGHVCFYYLTVLVNGRMNGFYFVEYEKYKESKAVIIASSNVKFHEVNMSGLLKALRSLAMKGVAKAHVIVDNQETEHLIRRFSHQEGPFFHLTHSQMAITKIGRFTPDDFLWHPLMGDVDQRYYWININFDQFDEGKKTGELKELFAQARDVEMAYYPEPLRINLDLARQLNLRSRFPDKKFILDLAGKFTAFLKAMPVGNLAENLNQKTLRKAIELQIARLHTLADRALNTSPSSKSNIFLDKAMFTALVDLFKLLIGNAEEEQSGTYDEGRRKFLKQSATVASAAIVMPGGVLKNVANSATKMVVDEIGQMIFGAVLNEVNPLGTAMTRVHLAQLKAQLDPSSLSHGLPIFDKELEDLSKSGGKYEKLLEGFREEGVLSEFEEVRPILLGQFKTFVSELTPEQIKLNEALLKSMKEYLINASPRQMLFDAQSVTGDLLEYCRTAFQEITLEREELVQAFELRLKEDPKFRKRVEDFQEYLQAKKEREDRINEYKDQLQDDLQRWLTDGGKFFRPRKEVQRLIDDMDKYVFPELPKDPAAAEELKTAVMGHLNDFHYRIEALIDDQVHSSESDREMFDANDNLSKRFWDWKETFPEEAESNNASSKPADQDQGMTIAAKVSNHQKTRSFGEHDLVGLISFVRGLQGQQKAFTIAFHDNKYWLTLQGKVELALYWNDDPKREHWALSSGGVASVFKRIKLSDQLTKLLKTKTKDFLLDQDIMVIVLGGNFSEASNLEEMFPQAHKIRAMDVDLQNILEYLRVWGASKKLRERVEIVRNNILTADERSKQYQLIYCSGTFQMEVFDRDPEKMGRAIHRVASWLKPEGLMVGNVDRHEELAPGLFTQSDAQDILLRTSKAVLTDEGMITVNSDQEKNSRINQIYTSLASLVNPFIRKINQPFVKVVTDVDSVTGAELLGQNNPRILFWTNFESLISNHQEFAFHLFLQTWQDTRSFINELNQENLETVSRQYLEEFAKLGQDELQKKDIKKQRELVLKAARAKFLILAAHNPPFTAYARGLKEDFGLIDPQVVSFLQELKVLNGWSDKEMKSESKKESLTGFIEEKLAAGDIEFTSRLKLLKAMNFKKGNSITSVAGMMDWRMAGLVAYLGGHYTEVTSGDAYSLFLDAKYNLGRFNLGENGGSAKLISGMFMNGASSSGEIVEHSQDFVLGGVITDESFDPQNNIKVLEETLRIIKNNGVFFLTTHLNPNEEREGPRKIIDELLEDPLHKGKVLIPEIEFPPLSYSIFEGLQIHVYRAHQVKFNNELKIEPVAIENHTIPSKPAHTIFEAPLTAAEQANLEHRFNDAVGNYIYAFPKDISLDGLLDPQQTELISTFRDQTMSFFHLGGSAIDLQKLKGLLDSIPKIEEIITVLVAKRKGGGFSELGTENIEGLIEGLAKFVKSVQLFSYGYRGWEFDHDYMIQPRPFYLQALLSREIRRANDRGESLSWLQREDLSLKLDVLHKKFLIARGLAFLKQSGQVSLYQADDGVRLDFRISGLRPEQKLQRRQENEIGSIGIKALARDLVYDGIKIEWVEEGDSLTLRIRQPMDGAMDRRFFDSDHVESLLLLFKLMRLNGIIDFKGEPEGEDVPRQVFGDEKVLNIGLESSGYQMLGNQKLEKENIVTYLHHYGVKNVFGIDPQVLEDGSMSPYFIKGVAQKIPFEKKGEFSWVISSFLFDPDYIESVLSLEHRPFDAPIDMKLFYRNVASEIWRVLKPGGRFVFDPLDDNPNFVKILEEQGFHPQIMTYPGRCNKYVFTKPIKADDGAMLAKKVGPSNDPATGEVTRFFGEVFKSKNNLSKFANDVLKDQGQGMHIVLIGPGNDAGDLEDLLKMCPKAHRIDVIDKRNNSNLIDHVIAKYKAEHPGETLPEIKFIYKNITDIQEEVKGADLVLGFHLFDLSTFEDEFMPQINQVLHRILRIGGILGITLEGYYFYGNSWLRNGFRVFELKPKLKGEYGFILAVKQDRGMLNKDNTTGGINLNPTQMSMRIQKEGEDFKFNFNGQNIDVAQVAGARFTILSLSPITNLPQILGLNK